MLTRCAGAQGMNKTNKWFQRSLPACLQRQACPNLRQSPANLPGKTPSAFRLAILLAKDMVQRGDCCRDDVHEEARDHYREARDHDQVVHDHDQGDVAAHGGVHHHPNQRGSDERVHESPIHLKDGVVAHQRLAHRMLREGTHRMSHADCEAVTRLSLAATPVTAVW